LAEEFSEIAIGLDKIAGLVLGDFLDKDFKWLSRLIKISGSVFESVIFFTNWFSNGVISISISGKGRVTVVGGVESEG